MEQENGIRKQQPATITVYPQHQQVITTVTVHPNEPPPVSSDPGITYVQLNPGHFTTFSGILKLVEIVSCCYCWIKYSLEWIGDQCRAETSCSFMPDYSIWQTK